MAQYIVPVRYGLMAVTETFTGEGEPVGLAEGAPVVVRTPRGVEMGEVAGRAQVVDREIKGLGSVLRAASDDDRAVYKRLKEEKEPEEFRTAQERARAAKLPIRLVGVEHLFSGEKIVFYFIAENRVDFRGLVKDLARIHRTRIEMRQIGVRDEAKLLADYEHCGRELCCRTFMKNLEPVTMRMAKVQKTTLDPTKISGHCGRLMCCLRFEDAVYTEFQQELPARGIVVVTSAFTGEVVGQDILRQEVTVLLSDGTREIAHVSEILEKRASRPRGPGAGPPERRPSRPGRTSGRFPSVRREARERPPRDPAPDAE